MGGVGSGRYGSKMRCEDCWQLDVSHFNSNRPDPLLIPGEFQCGGLAVFAWRYEDYIFCRYTLLGDGCGYEGEQKINIQRTKCNFGGERIWFLCPVCGNKFAKLYNTGIKFYCRHCLDLVYTTQSKTSTYRKRMKAAKIRKKLQNYTGISSYIFKPKCMHLSKYEDLYREVIRLENEYAIELCADFM